MSIYVFVYVFYAHTCIFVQVLLLVFGVRVCVGVYLVLAEYMAVFTHNIRICMCIKETATYVNMALHIYINIFTYAVLESYKYNGINI